MYSNSINQSNPKQKTTHQLHRRSNKKTTLTNLRHRITFGAFATLKHGLVMSTCSCADGFWRKHLPCCRNIDAYRKLLLGPKVTQLLEDKGLKDETPDVVKKRLRYGRSFGQTSFRDVLQKAKWVFSIFVPGSSTFQNLTEEMKAQHPELQSVLEEIVQEPLHHMCEWWYFSQISAGHTDALVQPKEAFRLRVASPMFFAVICLIYFIQLNST